VRTLFLTVLTHTIIPNRIRWKTGNGKKVQFWEDQWFENCSLAIQYWNVYILANEQNISVADAWDGV
jgi:hypothetical protein